MKKHVLFYSLASLIFCSSVFAQKGAGEKVQPEPVIAVEASAMNILYAGVENPVQIACSGINSSALKVEITNGTIKGSGGRYYISPGKASTLNLKIMNNEKLLGTRQFRVLSIPDPVANIIIYSGGSARPMNSGKVTLTQLMNSPGLTANVADFLFDVEFKIVSFTLSVPGETIVVVSKTSGSGKFSPEQKHILQALKPGQKIILEEIQAMGPDGVTRTLNSVELEIR